MEVAACTGKDLIGPRHSDKFVLDATSVMLCRACRGCATFSVRIIDPFTCLGPEIRVTFGGAGFRSRCDTRNSLALDLR